MRSHSKRTAPKAIAITPAKESGPKAMAAEKMIRRTIAVMTRFINMGRDSVFAV